MNTLLQSKPDALTVSRDHQDELQRGELIRDELHQDGAERTALPDMPATLTKDLVHLFKLLSDDIRLRILYFLAHEPELHVRALCDALHESQPAVSHHLALLREAGLIAPRRDGKRNFYHLVPQRFQDLLDAIFAAVPVQDRRYRFEDYVLSYAPASKPKPK